ncbi:MAG: hypothetical protein U0835_24910 [Isosphaeraceae bacterium]
MRPLWALFGPAALALLCLTPVLRTGYQSDDNHASLRPGLVRATGWSFGELVAFDARLSMQQGRFYPLHWIPFSGIHFLLTDTFIYKFYITLMVACDLAVFALLLRRLTGDAGFACLAATLTLMLVQLRAYHDPVLSFFGLLQLLVAGTLLSLLALDVYLERRRGAWLVLSVLIYLACLLLYEASYPLFLLHALLAWRRRPVWGDWLRTCRPFVQAAAFCVFMSLFLRWLHPLDFKKAAVTPMQYQTNAAPVAILGTLLRQATGVLPLGYFLADPAKLFGAVHPPAAFVRWVARWDVLAVVVAAGAVCLASLRRIEPRPAQGETTSPRPDWTLLALLGALLVVLPALPITLTARYQKEVEFFKPYVPVYVQYFGAGLLLASALRSALAARPAGGNWARWGRLSAALAVGLTTGVTYRANCATAEALASPPGSPTYNPAAYDMGGAWHQNRLNLQAALRAGLMDDVPEHSVLVLANQYRYWYDAELGGLFYATYASKRFNIAKPPAKKAGAPGGPRKPAVPYVVRDVCLGEGSGYVVALPASRRRGRPGTALFVRHPRLFGEGSSPTVTVLARGSSPGEADGPRDAERVGPDAPQGGARLGPLFSSFRRGPGRSRVSAGGPEPRDRRVRRGLRPDRAGRVGVLALVPGPRRPDPVQLHPGTAQGEGLGGCKVGRRRPAHPRRRPPSRRGARGWTPRGSSVS